jgi:hypothetical protein
LEPLPGRLGLESLYKPAEGFNFNTMELVTGRLDWNLFTSWQGFNFNTMELITGRLDWNLFTSWQGFNFNTMELLPGRLGLESLYKLAGVQHYGTVTWQTWTGISLPAGRGSIE